MAIRELHALPKDLRDWQRWIAEIETQGNFTATLTGCDPDPTGTVEWIRLGRRIVLFADSAITGTSDATSLTLTGVPTSVTPESTRVGPVILTDNGSSVIGLASITSTTITFSCDAPFSTTGFTNTGTKGLPAGFSFWYVL